MKKIIIKGARQHNLKNIDLEIPKDQLIVITGLSGSGKSSLAFDTLYAEGQRRYVESLSAYARQFLERMDKPDVDSIEGLSPAIAIEQKNISKNPRSTVGTVTEIYDYFRLLFARVGRPFCFKCEKPISAQTISQMADAIMQYPTGEKGGTSPAIEILAPIVRERKGEYKKELQSLKQKGFVRARIDGKMIDLSVEDSPSIKDKYKKHTIEAVIDRLILKAGIERRLTDSLELAAKMGDGVVRVVREKEEVLFSEHLSCIDCGVSYPEIEPRIFSFNAPQGACVSCSGLGTTLEIDPDKVVPNRSLSLREGAMRPWDQRSATYYYQILEALATHYHFDLHKPFQKLSEANQKIILQGSGSETILFHYDQEGKKESYTKPFEGVLPNLARRYKETDSSYIREEIAEYMMLHPCPSCKGNRLKPESLAIKIANRSIACVTRLSISDAYQFILSVTLTNKEQAIAQRILKEIRERLLFLINVGVGYLTMDRTACTLSGGEGQRIRLATQIGSSLTGVLYILDEPSIGLHQRDNMRLLNTLKKMRDLGNTVLVVEHDEETIRNADWVIDMGPAAGVHGGTVVAQGTPKEVMANNASLTGQYLTGKKVVKLATSRRRPKQFLKVVGASENNLQQIDVSFPMSCFTCVTGVSGSGKSTLVLDVLYKNLATPFIHFSEKPGACKKIVGGDQIDKIIDIDQSPIGRTPRSNSSTYTGVFTFIRDLFTQLPASKMRGYKEGRYSFNVKGGRCEACTGEGLIKIEMHFLPDVYVMCEDCKGRRYNRETLDIHYRGKSIADVLDMTIESALDFFKAVPMIAVKLATLCEVGLGYITLGQSATTLSGGEAQRIKLSKELSKRATGKTLYILDEPTTGLHFSDIQKLLDVLNKLVQMGNTVIVIEHNLDVIRNADWIIDLGPEGGPAGGKVIAFGTPEDVARVPHSYTGQFLKKIL
jgi:excinuclease ABC subunit A